MAVYTNRRLRLSGGGLKLTPTLMGGQSFSWTPNDNGRCVTYAGVAGGRAVRVWEDAGYLLLENLSGGELSLEDEVFWRHYFALDVDYTALQKRLCRNAALARCVACAPGTRVLRQPFFETLLAFIISQNNHIPRITGIVGRLRRGFGPALAGGVHGFPAPEKLAALRQRDLDALGAGYRAKYLIEAAHEVASGNIKETDLHEMSTGQARNALLGIRGVGPKVADCVLLFGLGRHEVAPMDVWMKRAVDTAFGGQMPACAAGVEGIAQQYIFAWARENLPRGGGRGKTAKPDGVK